MRRTTVALILLSAGCQTQEGGSGDGFSVDACRFEEVAGVATIVAVQDAPADFPPVYCPNDPVQVLFDFIADDPQADTQGEQVGLTLTQDQQFGTSREYVPRAWVEDEGLTEGTEHRCILHLGEGFCPNPFGTFPDVDYEAAEEGCQ